MTFSKLAQFFEKLEATTKRLELVNILAQLFKEAKPAEIGQICYLVQGRVVPTFEPVEIGMAEKMVAAAVADAFKTNREDVIKSYGKLGVMGLAAKQLAESSQLTVHSLRPELRPRSLRLTVNQVFAKLLEIAKFSGEGTVGKKISTLSSLLLKLDPVSAKHLVRIPLGTLRLGIGDPTVLDALSQAKKGDKSARPVLENAYNKTSDLGYIAQIFWSTGESGISRIKLVIGKPVRPALAERLPNPAEIIKRVGSEFGAEPKFDGFRVSVHKDGGKVLLFSRNLEDTTQAFPDIVDGVIKQVKARSAILEGEAIAFNPQTEEFLPFQETTKRRRKYQVTEMAEKLPLVLFAFDLLYFEGQDLTDQPYRERRKKLAQIISKDLPAGRHGNKIIRLAEQRILHSETEMVDFFEESVSDGLEGLMIKKLDSPYKAGARGFHWVKFKRAQSGELTDTVDCVLLGIYAGRGKRAEFGVGGLLVGVYDEAKDQFVTISRVGTGLTDDEWRGIKDTADKLQVKAKPARVYSLIEPSIWVEPKIVLEIYADEITRSPVHTAGKTDSEPGYALRFPRLVKFREADKGPEDATTVGEIVKMYNQQFSKARK